MLIRIEGGCEGQFGEVSGDQRWLQKYRSRENVLILNFGVVGKIFSEGFSVMA
jgi:hypothetical protein